MSNGAGVAVPFLVWARLVGVPFVFLEVEDRAPEPSLTGRLAARLATVWVATDPCQREAVPHAVWFGSLL